MQASPIRARGSITTTALTAAGVLALFVAASYLVSTYQPAIARWIGGGGFWHGILYVLIIAAEGVIAPVNALPLIPIAVGLWTTYPAALLTLVGWSIGASIAFWLTRRYGESVVRRFVSLDKLQRIGRVLPRHHLFWVVLSARILVPTDLMNYAIPLTLPVSFGQYLLASTLGFLPWAFAWPFLSQQSPLTQAGIVAGGLVLFALGWYLLRKYQR